MVFVCCRAPSSVANSYVNLLLFLCFFLFCSRYPQNQRADHHQIFQKDGKWAAIEQLSFSLLNSFGCRRKVQIGHFRFGSSFTICIMVKKNQFTYREKKVVWLWPCNLSTKCWKSRENLSRDGRDLLVHLVHYKHGGAPLTTLPSSNVNRRVFVVC